MRLKPPPLEIDPKNPWAADALHREQLAVPLNALIRSADQPLVISLEAPWGGKSTFLNMWTADLDLQNALLSFNAWESDFSGAALVSLLAELETGLEEIAPIPRVKKLLGGLKRAAGGVPIAPFQRPPK